MSESVSVKEYRDSKSSDKEDEIMIVVEDNKSKPSSSTSVWEIEEEEECFELSSKDDHSIRDSIINNTNGVAMGSLAAIREELDGSLLTDDDDVVYVGVGKSNSSMDALVWLLANISICNSETTVFLIHVFPELRFIPTPLGKLPISQVNPQQKETYLIQERTKRRDFLQKFLNVCAASKVKVDTILIESDMEAKALLDLIPILNIKKLVLGTAKSSLRKLKSRKGNGIVDQVLQNAPDYCVVKVICEGELVDTVTESIPPSPSASPSSHASVANRTQTSYEEQNTNSFGCVCFKAKINR